VVAGAEVDDPAVVGPQHAGVVAEVGGAHLDLGPGLGRDLAGARPLQRDQLLGRVEDRAGGR
jgi:hypothetical protein